MLHALDCETWPIRPGQVSPRLVSVAFQTGQSQPAIFHRSDDWQSHFRSVISCALRDGTPLVNQNIAFDFRVLINEEPSLAPLIWQLYDSDLVCDPMITAILLSIAHGEPQANGTRKAMHLGGFALADLAKRHLGETIEGKGPDAWRTRYHELDSVPIKDWPAAAREYAIEDPGWALRVFQALRNSNGGARPRGETRGVRTSWALGLAESWGVRTDPEYVEALKTHLTAHVAECYDRIRQAPDFNGWLRSNGSRDMVLMRERIEAALPEHERAERITPTGKRTTDRDTLEACVDAEDLAAWVDQGEAKTELTTFVPRLEEGTALPIHARWWPIVESERLSCRNPNLTNLPRRSMLIGGVRVGVRSCYVPRPGFVFSAADFGTAELRAFAQICLWWFGHSAMAQAFKDQTKGGLDLHSKLAARILGISDNDAKTLKAKGDEDFDRTRHVAKQTNFGRLGGMGNERFILTCRKDGVDLTLGGRLGNNLEEIAEALKLKQFALFPEIPEYFARINSILRESGGDNATITSAGTGLVRGNVGYCDTCNHFFQNLVAQWTKDALYVIARECYNVPSSPLYGSRPIIVPHDETILEVPEYKAGAAADRQAEIMRLVASASAPDVPIECEAALMRRWDKRAKPVRVNGILVPWEA